MARPKARPRSNPRLGGQDMDALRQAVAKATKEMGSAGLTGDAYAARSMDWGLEIERGEMNFAAHSSDAGIGVRVLKEGRIGFAYMSIMVDPAETVRRAIAVAPFGSPVAPEFPADGGKAVPKVSGIYDEAVAALEPEAAYELVERMMDSAKGLDPRVTVPAGGVGWGHSIVAMANTSGQETAYEVSSVGISLQALVGSGKGKKANEEKTTAAEGMDSPTLAKGIDPEWVGREAARLALESRGGKEIKGGELDVIFAPVVIAELLDTMFVPAISGERVAIGESIYSGKMGEQVLAPHISIWDDGIMPGGLATAPVDDEGTPSRRKPIVENGVLRSFLYDIVTAKRYGGVPTGNAIRPGYNGMPHAAPRNLVIEGRQRPLDKLIASVDEGLLVYDVLGAHTGNLTSTEFSVNSTILFKIEKGAIEFPVASAMISGNLATALSQVEALGDDRRIVPIGTPYYLPSALFKGLRVTG